MDNHAVWVFLGDENLHLLGHCPCAGRIAAVVDEDLPTRQDQERGEGHTDIHDTPTDGVLHRRARLPHPLLVDVPLDLLVGLAHEQVPAPLHEHLGGIEIRGAHRGLGLLTDLTRAL